MEFKMDSINKVVSNAWSLFELQPNEENAESESVNIMKIALGTFAIAAITTYAIYKFKGNVKPTPSNHENKVSAAFNLTFDNALIGLVPDLIDKKIIPSRFLVKDMYGNVDVKKILEKVQKATIPELVYMRQFHVVYAESNQPLFDLIKEIVPQEVDNCEEELNALFKENEVTSELDHFCIEHIDKKTEYTLLTTRVSPFTKAVKEKNYVAVEAFLKCNTDPYQRQCSKDNIRTHTNTAMSIAIEAGDEKMVRLLLKYVKNKKDLNLPSCGHEPALLQAIQGGKKAIVDILIEDGASVDFKTEWKQTPFCRAALVNDVETGKKILSRLDKEKHEIACEFALARSMLNGTAEFCTFILKEVSKLDLPPEKRLQLVLTALADAVQLFGRRDKNFKAIELALDSIKEIEITEEQQLEVTSQVTDKCPGLMEFLSKKGFKKPDEEPDEITYSLS